MAKSNAVIIKRVKKSDAGHHGGAWKVAYADFVTAMMAFFLLLWLLNATTNAQKRGIADYFAPTVASKSTTSGSGGVLGGRSPTEPGSQVSSTAPAGITTSFTPPQDFQENDEDNSPGQAPNPNDQDSNSNGNPNSARPTPNPNGQPSGAGPTNAAGQAGQTGQSGAAGQDNASGQTGQTNASSNNPFLPFNTSSSAAQTNPYAAPPTPAPDQTDTSTGGAHGKISDKQFEKLKAESEEKQFQKAQFDLQQAIQQVPDLKSLAKNLLIDRTEEGLRIQIVDQEKTAMFDTGSTSMSSQAQKLMALVSQAITKLPNKISITGHTDATPYSGRTDYTNWELSADRANTARRALISQGFPEARIATVVGKADTDNFIKDNAFDPRNRRISIVVLRENKLPATSGPAGPDDGASAVAPGSGP